MALDFKQLNSGLTAKKQLDPRKIFSTLNRDIAKFKRPSDEQGEVLDKWFEKRARTDNTLKMNTGSGKTVVGLLCLQSCLNENVGPAVYITPDKYLLTQVRKEAKSLGISVTEDEHDPDFLSGKSILIINIWKLINGKSVFGVTRQGIKINIGSLIIDDAHACISTVADQFRLTIPSKHPSYKEILSLFSDSLKQQSPTRLLDVIAEDPQAIMEVPFWAWQEKQAKVLSILHPYRSDETFQWKWPLISDVISLCQCVIGNGMIEIAPRFLPIDNIPAFSAAKRRIYMTATLADDGVLVSHFQADPDQVADPISPKGGGDIGDRMILAPQEINPSITTNDIKNLAAHYAKKINVSVIVPSKKRAAFWEDVADQILTSDNMEAGTEALRNGHVGLTVFVAKYDGVDLPKKACELLIIDGLPEVNGLIDRYEQNLLDGTRKQLIKQIQRIEQGMGRGVRSSEDHCVVLLLGARLTQRIHHPDARMMFSVATRAQLDLGRAASEQYKGHPIEDFPPLLSLCLNSNDDWVEASRTAVANADDVTPAHVDDTMINLRKAFDHARLERFDLSAEAAQIAVNLTSEKLSKGYYKQQLAEYTQHIDPLLAQELQVSAVQLNRRLTKPIKGIIYRKLLPPTHGQALSAVEYMKSRFLDSNALIIWSNALIEALAWGEENSKRFEAAILDLGAFIGFGSQRPEEDGRGPDNLWALGELQYLVIECKSGATEAKNISKHDCNQLNGSMSWFTHEYDKTCSATPVLIHPKLKPEHSATLHEATRIIDEECLAKLTENLRKYSIAIGKNLDFCDSKIVSKQLDHFSLTREKFTQHFSKNPKH